MNLVELKKKHKKIFCTDLYGLKIFFRAFTWGEFKSYYSAIKYNLVPREQLYEDLFKEIVFSEDIINEMYTLPAGIVDSIVNLAFHISGNPLETKDDIDRLNTDINEVRSLMENHFVDQYLAFICRAFPAYTPTDLEQFDWPEILRLLLLAEISLKQQESRVIPLQDNSFVVTKYPSEGKVNLVFKKPETAKTKENFFEQIKEDSKSLMQADVGSIKSLQPEQTYTPEQIEKLRQKQRQLEEMQKKNRIKKRR